MVIYILITLALYKIQIFLAPSLGYILGGKKQMLHGMGARDLPTEMSVIGGRLKRASENLKEALPIFLTLALLAELKGATDGLTEMGALTFVIARIAYIPAYVINIGPLRSIVWTIAFIGMVLMLVGMWPTLGL